MYPTIYKTIILPGIDLYLNTAIKRLWNFYEESQWWSLDEHKAWQDVRLKILISHVYNNVPYYHRVMQERGLKPNDVTCVDDLIKLPLLTKKIIRQEYKSIISSDIEHRHAKLNSTGGTTGEPLQYYADWEAWSADWACIYRGWGFAGYQPGEKIATLAGSSLIPDKSNNIVQRIRLRLERNLPLSVVVLSREIAWDYVEQLNSYRPVCMRGYPTALYVFAYHIRAMNLKMPKLKAIFTTAEVLQPQHRALIEEVFQCPVFDGFGARDGGVSAYECDHHEGMHLSLERGVVELLDDAGDPTNKGRLIITDLYNFSMPFIRYEVGDIGEISNTPCSCGRGLPLLTHIEGRITDILKFSNGRTLSGPAVTLIFRKTGFTQYQLVQKDESSLIVRYVPGDHNTNNADVEETRKIIKHHLGDQVMISYEQVDDIQPTMADKRRFIISEIEG